MDKLLRTRVQLSYQGADISADVSRDLVAFSYTDNENGAVDDLTVTLKDIDGKWRGPWLPSRGDTLIATIYQEGRGARAPLPCGKFTIDELEISGPPSVIVIKAVAIPDNDDVRQCSRSKAWEDVPLAAIAGDVAAAGGLALQFLSPTNPTYDRRDQVEESDLEFLERLCRDEGLAVKVNSYQLVAFDPDVMAQGGAVAAFVLGESNVKQWSLKGKTHDVYGKCVVEYQDPADGKIKAYTYTDAEFQGKRGSSKKLDKLKSKGKTLKLVKRAVDMAEAKRLAAGALADANRNEVTGSLEVMGDTRLVTGSSITLVNFGAWDGKYFISKSTHTIGGQSGYTTSLEIRNTILEGGGDG